MGDAVELAGCIIKDETGKVLLIHRNTAKRVEWEIPGGKIDTGETPEQTAIRELQEELGITVELVRSLGAKNFVREGISFTYHWFVAEIVTGTPTLKEDMHDDLRHFTVEEMLKIMDTLSANTKRLITAVQNKEVTL